MSDEQVQADENSTADVPAPPEPKKGAFVDAAGVLTSWGYAESNGTDTRMDVADDFALEPGKWRWTGSDWVAYVAPMTEGQALAKRADLLAEAARQIAPLQDAVDIDEATAVEVALLKKWKQYRVALNRVPEQPGFPANVQWPEVPQ